MGGEMEDAIEAKYPGIRSMFDQVFQGLQSAFGDVVLKNGLLDAKWCLGSMGKLFAHSVKPFIDASSKVTGSFIGNGDPNTARLHGNLSTEYAQTVKNTSVAAQLMLADQ